MKVGTLVNFIPPHNQPIPIIQGIILDVVEQFHSENSTQPVTHYDIHWFTGQQGGLFLGIQLEVAK